MLIKSFKIFLSKFDNFNKKYVIFENSKINLSLSDTKSKRNINQKVTLVHVVTKLDLASLTALIGLE